MRAFVVTGPGESGVQDVEPPRAAPGQVVVDIELVGVCGTDVELFTGNMPYLKQGNAAYPIRLGHEWAGTITALGEGVDPTWLGRRTTGATIIGCGVCRRCLKGLHHVCEDRREVGIRRGLAGALAEQLAMPVDYLHPLPDSVDDVAGALVEPGGSALRAVRAAEIHQGDQVLIFGPGTMGSLIALFAMSCGARVHMAGLTAESLAFARTLGVEGAWTLDEIPDLPFDSAIDATFSPDVPLRALEAVEPSKRVVYVGLAETPSTVDARALVLKDLTVIGILGGNGGFDGAIELYASGAVDPRPLVAGTVKLEAVGGILAGSRPDGVGPGPKLLVDPRA